MLQSLFVFTVYKHTYVFFLLLVVRSSYIDVVNDYGNITNKLYPNKKNFLAYKFGTRKKKKNTKSF